MNIPATVATIHSQAPAIAHQSVGAMVMFDSEMLDRALRMSEVMAKGAVTIPQELRGKPGDCMAIVLQAMEWKMNPFALAQKSHFISGKIGFESQAICAAIAASGAIKESAFAYEWFGPWEKIIGKFVERQSSKKTNEDGSPQTYRAPGWSIADEAGLGVIVRATLRGESAPRELTLLMTQARTRNSTLWADDPKQQLAYLAAKRWGRLYAPGVILGAYSPDELSEPAERFMGEAEVVQDPPRKPAETSRSDALKDKLKGKAAPKAESPATAAETVQARILNVPEQFTAADTVLALTAVMNGLTAEQRREHHAGFNARLAELKAKQGPATDNGSLNPAAGWPAATRAQSAAPPGELFDQAAQTGAPEILPDKLERQIKEAKDEEALFACGDLIGAVTDPHWRDRLGVAFKARLKELQGGIG